MDDFFGTFLYIIISVVIFAISALGKRKKKMQNPGMPVNKAKSEPSIFEQLFDEKVNEPVYEEQIYDEFEDEVQYERSMDRQPETIQEVKAEKPYSVEYDQTARASVIAEEVNSSADGIKDGEISAEGDAHDDSEGFDLEEFDAQDAIVYSEIMNRKYV